MVEDGESLKGNVVYYVAVHARIQYGGFAASLPAYWWLVQSAYNS